ncbi:hypothetical protein SAMN05216311_120100 [Chitinophaga sp. CF418]|nr:hypothetical protein SAMN05216311_120100 [Chitinophaga sp. CF418]
MKFFEQELNFTLLKENTKALIVVPTVVGGIWQMMELLSIGTSFLRFFSITQLVSDGLLILFILSLCGFICWLLYLSYLILSYDNSMLDGTKFPEIVAILNGDKTENKIFYVSRIRQTLRVKIYSYLKLAALIGLIIFAFYCLIWPIMSRNISGKTLTAIDYVVWVTGLGLISVAFIGTINAVFFIQGWALNVINDYVVVIKETLKCLVLGGIVGFVIFIAPIFHESFLLPTDLKNNDYIIQQVHARNPKVETWYVEYFNDKYIFINVTDSIGNRIEVMRFDIIFPVEKP